MSATFDARQLQRLKNLLGGFGKVEEADVVLFGERYRAQLAALDRVEEGYESRLAAWVRADTEALKASLYPLHAGDPVPDAAAALASKTLPLSQYLAGGSAGEWLVTDLLYENTIAMLWGSKESFKTFVAIDLAFCVALGRPWHGRTVQQGRVVYVLGEGGDTFKRRLWAWLKHTGQQVDDSVFQVRPEMPRLTDHAEAQAFIEEMIALAPKLLVIDTLFWAMVGGDENSNADIARALSALKAIQQATRTAVLLIHHPGVSGGRPRGGYGGPAGVDTSIEAVRKGDQYAVTLHLDKQKDDAKPLPIVVALEKIDTGLADRESRPIWSLVLTPGSGESSDTPPATVQEPRSQPDDANRAKAMVVLNAAGPNGLTATEWETRSGIKPATMKRTKHYLELLGAVRSAKKGRNVRWTSARYPIGLTIGLTDSPAKDEFEREIAIGLTQEIGLKQGSMSPIDDPRDPATDNRAHKAQGSPPLLRGEPNEPYWPGRHPEPGEPGPDGES